jgi:DNA polymerase-3 subunit delta'
LLAHAYLFCGPHGVGKRLFAHELAKALLCENRSSQQLEACDSCLACRLMEAATHPDFFSFRRPEDRLEFPVELAKEMCQGLGLKPARGKNKVVILEDADDLNEESSNCLLKTLEEPPPGSVLILIALSPERLLATIVSRCQVVYFRPLSADLVREILLEHGIEEAQLDRLARLSRGSPGVALELVDPALWECRTQLVEGLLAGKSNSVALARQWMHFLEETGKEAGVQRRAAELMLRLLIDFFRDMLRAGVGAEPASAEPGDVRILREMGQRVDAETCLQIIERCLEAELHIDRRVQLVLAVEGVVNALEDKLQHATRR